MFSKILIANRGEIACRVIRTAKQLGIQTVAVYSDADRDALHVRMADEACHIGPPVAAKSYLVAESIMLACQSSGATAIHPGYGFLSEDATFAERLTDAGIEFIGPGTAAIRAMGDKITSKMIAREAGVNVIPGFDDVIESPDHAIELARQIGYPVMLKPTAAGGGKGMRLAYNDAQCRDGFIRSASEARTYFGDDRVFVEKYIENPRHIEVQVLADKLGNIVHLGERECSLQRRHQKVIEEAPSPFLNDATRHSITEQAVALARAVDYVSAGTVEFVVDAEQNFYFLEMNTRLQVEHPVTEYITGIDLVEQMIKIAAGEPLDKDQAQISTSGWAIEARIYAEDPARNFLPSTGRLVRCRPPVASEFVRIDTGVTEGGEVSIYYDPMIAKLIVYQDTREDALALLAQSLDEYQIEGVSTNLPFLQALVRDPVVSTGMMHTSYIESRYPDGYDCETQTNDSIRIGAMIATIVHYMIEQHSEDLNSHRVQRWSAAQEWITVSDQESFEFTIEKTERGHRLTTDEGNTATLNHAWVPGQRLFYFTTKAGGQQCVQVTRVQMGYQVDFFGIRRIFNVLSQNAALYNQYMPEKSSTGVSPFLKSPMPGRLQELRVTQGQMVKSGDTVAIVEAMKMENALQAERDGVVVDILANVGDSLAADQPILEFGEPQQ